MCEYCSCKFFWSYVAPGCTQSSDTFSVLGFFLFIVITQSLVPPCSSQNDCVPLLHTSSVWGMAIFCVHLSVKAAFVVDTIYHRTRTGDRGRKETHKEGDSWVQYNTVIGLKSGQLKSVVFRFYPSCKNGSKCYSLCVCVCVRACQKANGFLHHFHFNPSTPNQPKPRGSLLPAVTTIKGPVYTTTSFIS